VVTFIGRLKYDEKSIVIKRSCMKRKLLYQLMFLTSCYSLQVFAAVNVTKVLQVIRSATSQGGKIKPGAKTSGNTPPGNIAPVIAKTTIVPKGTSDTITVTPPAATKLLPNTVNTFAIPAAITSIQVWPATNVGDLYTVFNFKAATLALINAALAQGKSLMFGLNVQQSNANYNVTATVYDLQGNQIAQEVRNSVVNKSGVTNTANIAIGTPITAPAVFSYYSIDVEVQGQKEAQSANGLSLDSSVIFAAAAQSIAINSPIQSMSVWPATNVGDLYAEFAVSVQNIVDMNKALSTGQSLTLFVECDKNASGSYDATFVAYDATGDIVAQETRRAVVNASGATNSANIANGVVIPATAAQFTYTGIQYQLLNDDETVQINNLPLTNTIMLTSSLPASSVVELPQDVNALTSLSVTPNFATGTAIAFGASDMTNINAALAVSHAIAVNCQIMNDQLAIGVYDYVTDTLLAMDLSPVTAAEISSFSDYSLAYVYTGQAAAVTPVQMSAGDSVTIVPSLPTVSVTSTIAAGATGATSFTANASSLQEVVALAGTAYNHNSPASIAGGLAALNFISAQFTDGNSTAFIKFDFTKQNGLQNITQELLNNGLYVCFNVMPVSSGSSSYVALVTLEDAQSNVYASGSAPITTQMVWGWVGFNMETSATPVGANTTYVKQIPIASGAPAFYCQQPNVTSAVQ